MSLPIGIPRWVAEGRRGRSGQGQFEISRVSFLCERLRPEEMTQLLTLLMPSPERKEKREKRERAGEMSEMVKADKAMSSAKA